MSWLVRGAALGLLMAGSSAQAGKYKLNAKVIAAEYAATFGKPRPTLPDPKAQEYRQAFEQDKQSFTSGGQFFPGGDGPNACPQITVEDIKALVERISGTGLDQTYYDLTEVRGRAVDGDCKNGGRDGMVWLALDFVTAQRAAVAGERMRELRQAWDIRATVADGKLAGPFRAYHHSVETHPMPGVDVPAIKAVQGAPTFNFWYGDNQQGTWNGPIVGFGFQQGAQGHWTTLREQLAPGSAKTRGIERVTYWTGGDRGHVIHLRAGKQHGEHTWSDSVFNGNPIPAASHCYVEGQLRLDARCDGPQVLDPGTEPTAGKRSVDAMRALELGEAAVADDAAREEPPAPAAPAARTTPPAPAAPKPPPVPAAADGDPMARLKKLKELLDAGLISQEEFDSKKAEILESL